MLWMALQQIAPNLDRLPGLEQTKHILGRMQHQQICYNVTRDADSSMKAGTDKVNLMGVAV